MTNHDQFPQGLGRVDNLPNRRTIFERQLQHSSRPCRSQKAYPKTISSMNFVIDIATMIKGRANIFN
jgi:hypothetical protein